MRIEVFLFLMYQFLCVLEVRSGYGEASARDYGGT
jgi:hypothetical protein